MPWSGGSYVLPAGTAVSPNTTIQSTWANTLTADLESGMNFTRPIARGGTGSTTAVGAADNLSTISTDIASSATTDLSNATGIHVTITGTTTITGFGTEQAGAIRVLTFDDALTLTHNATSLILPGGIDLTTAPGDVLTFVSLGSGNWRCIAAPARITKWSSRLIGEIIYVNTGLAGVEIPPQDGGFIELSAGLDGAGEYNEGKLTSETITGTAPLVVATAVIDDADSPMDGETINLINTEERVRYAGERAKAGDVFNDQMQQITGTFARSTSRVGTGNPGTLSGAFSYGGSGQVGFMTSAVNSGSDFTLEFDSADSPGARTGDRTRAKGQFLVAFLKYKDVA